MPGVLAHHNYAMFNIHGYIMSQTFPLQAKGSSTNFKCDCTEFITTVQKSIATACSVHIHKTMANTIFFIHW